LHNIKATKNTYGAHFTWQQLEARQEWASGRSYVNVVRGIGSRAHRENDPDTSPNTLPMATSTENWATSNEILSLSSANWL
jgi:hypothetical protein